MHVRRAHERGHANQGWLDTWHTFSFANYHDPRWMGFRSLRVLNDDRIAPGSGFPMHPHEDMEILTVVLSGTLSHEDTLGNGSRVVPGDVQYMSAGTGVRHSEVNPSDDEPLHLLQVWILPDRGGAEPRYGQKAFPEAERLGRLRVVASRSGEDDSIRIRQDADVRAGLIGPGQRLCWTNAPGRGTWLHVARGELVVQGRRLQAGDAAYTTDAEALALEGGTRRAEVLLFDLA